MPTLLLLRHGQASAHGADYDVLSDVGHAQAAVAGRELARRGVDPQRYLSGTLNRQVDTARAALPDAALETDARWNEYDHLAVLRHHAPASALEGLQEGRVSLQDALDASLLDWVAAGDTSDAPEPWPVFTARIGAALRDVVTGAGKGRTVVVTTSGGVIAALAASLIGGSTDTFVALNRVTVNAAITTFLIGRRGVSLSAFNDHAHLLESGITYR